jgi:hypothetical protein
MAEPKAGDTFFPLGWNDPLHGSIGRVANAWALFEFHVSQLIWIFSGADDEHGACITAQIYTIQGKINALLALARLEGVPEETIKEFGKALNKDIEALSRARNRIVHDPWMEHGTSGEAFQIMLTAQRKLEYRFEPADMLSVEDTLSKIEALDQEFQKQSIKLRANARGGPLAEPAQQPSSPVPDQKPEDAPGQ